MNPFIKFKPLSCIILTICFVSCATDEQESSSPKLFYTFIPVRPDMWWKIYVNGTNNISGIPYVGNIDKIDQTKAITLNFQGHVLGHIESDEIDIDDSVLNWQMVKNISDKVVEEVFKSDRGNGADERVTNGKVVKSGRDAKYPDSLVLDSPELNLARRIVSIVPPFVPSSSSRVTNEQCIKDSQHYLQELNNFALWALKMHDSSAKLPPGLLNGNVNQYGDIDQCLNVKSTWYGSVIKGRYCLATMSLHLADPDRPLLEHVRKLLMSNGMLRSSLDDPGHRVPRFSSIHWALCVPASCSHSDVEVALTEVLQRYSEGTGIAFKVRVTSEMCQTKDDKLHLPTETIIIGGLFLTIAALAIIATMCDPDWRMSGQKLSTIGRLMQAFSLRKNSLTLFSLSRSSDDIESIHGVRALSALLLLIAHKCMALFFNPYLNRTTMAENLGKPWTSFARGACIHTDPFIMMSGLLTSYSFYKQLERSKKLDIPREYISRLMRLVPNLVAIILLSTFIIPWIGTGPLWNQVVRHHSDICKTNWWRNMLFIHNYFGFENMCLTHTHHLGIDTQLFAFSPIFVYLVWRWPRLGLSSLAGIAAISTALCYNTTYSKHLTHFIVHGSSVRQLFKTADISYTLPAHRASVYVLGIAFGFLLRYCGRDFRLKKMHLTLGWTAAAVCFYIAMISPAHMASSTYVYNPTEAANFAAFAPIAWCLCIGWIIFISFIGQGGLISQLLSWRGFLVTTRLSYAVYLVQFPIFFYTVGTNRVTQIYSVLLLIDVPEMVTIAVAAILLTLLFDLPFQNMRRILLKKPK